MRFFGVEEDTEILGVLIDFPDHKFEKVGVIGNIFLFFECVLLRYKLFLIDLHQEID